MPAAAEKPCVTTGLQTLQTKKPASDIIVKVGETAVKSAHDFQFGVLSYKPGEKIPVVVNRSGKELPFQVVARQRKDGLADEIESAAAGQCAGKCRTLP